MKKTILNYKKTALAISLMFVVLGCSKKLDRYEDPTWLGGTSIETLQKDGHYTIFLQLMDLAGSPKKTVEKQLTTLFAPDDDAFKRYFQKVGISSLNDLTKEQALELFNRHFIAKALNTNYLVYEKQYTLLESEKGEYASLFYRKVTSAQPDPYLETPKYDPNFKGKQLLMQPGLKLIPIYSNIFFKDFNGDGAVDYPFMYPGSKWNGYMAWHNANIINKSGKAGNSIEDYASPTASGFIYYLEDVVNPLINGDQYLATLPNNSVFYDMLQRLVTYKNSSLVDPKGRKLFDKTYPTGFSNLYSENCNSSYPDNLLRVYTVFAPTNDAMQAYIDNTLVPSFGSIDSIPMLTMQLILQSHITNRLELKSKFTKKFFNFYGDVSVVDAANITPVYMASNMMIYETKKLMLANAFTCVPGKLFLDKKYSTFAQIINNSNSIVPLSGENEVTLFAATNDELLAENIRALNVAGTVNIQVYNTQDGQWKTILSDDLLAFAQDHIYLGNIGDLKGEGYVEMLSHNYVHYSNNTLNAGLNDFNGSKATIVEPISAKNGTLYTLDHPILTRYRMSQLILNDPDMSIFARLLIKAKILQTDYIEKTNNESYPYMKMIESVGAFYWTAFVPSNSAMSKAINDKVIDTTSASAVLDFVNYHFVQKTIFDNGQINGTFNTLLSGKPLAISNSLNDLKVTDASGQQVSILHSDADKLVKRGVVHKITSVLKSK
jgi:uncharacterized surface protein with fasciclin (FAS1) repeats